MKEKQLFPKIDMPNLLVAIFTILVLTRNLFPIPGIISNALIACSGGIGFLFVFLKKYKQKSMWKIIALGLFLSICMLSSIFYNHNASLGEILWIWCFMGIALLFYQFDIDSTWFVYFFYILTIYFLICAVMRCNINAILYGTSRNGIAALLLFLMLWIYLGREKKEKIWYLPAALSVVISAWSLSRAGLLTAIFFLVIIVLYDFIIRKKGNIKRLAGVGIFLIIALFLVTKVFPTNDSIVDREEIQFDENSEQNTTSNSSKNNDRTIVSKFAGQKLASVRTKIWKEYFYQAANSGKELFFGVTYEDGFYLKKYGQPHNGFLVLHSKFGFLGFVAVMILLLFTFINECRRKNILKLIIFIVVLMRAFFDWIVFPGYYDALIWFFVFESLFKMRSDNEKV